MKFLVLSVGVLLVAMGCGAGSTSSSGSQLCTPEKKKCDGSDLVKCNAAGEEWVFFKECPNGCKSGACLEAPACSPKCEGMACGDDGCGGSCGNCPGGGVCNQGQCCTPACTTVEGGKAECGPNGCGGTCGECPVAAPVCDKGHCIPDCTPNCAGKECGDDGCGGSCGTCPDAAPLCEAGTCQPVCKPNCGGKECGGDGCGGSCGSCDTGEQCEKGVCKCVPQCDGKDCGIDGCGGVCGKCAGQDACENGKCVCQPDCDSAECGPDGCGGQCGTCQQGADCDFGTCVCEPKVDVGCCKDAICWVDSCGELGEVVQNCALGCKDEDCVLPQTVAVWVEEAILGPADLEGSYWDVEQQIGKELLKQVSNLMKSSGNPWGSVAGFLLDLFAGPLLAELEKPDPYGAAQVFLNGLHAPELDLDIAKQSTYHPTWVGLGWTDLPVSGGLAIKLVLFDADLGFWNNDDPFGSVQIDKQEILDAMNNPGDPDKCWVDVSAESSQTVLLVKIAAYPTDFQCKPECGGKQCGPDGCGGSCGTCQPGYSCSGAGLCVAGLPDDCNGVTFEGCCQGNSLVWCEDGKLTGGSCDEHPLCGWVGEYGYYDCGTDGTADPAGTYPLSCPPGTCAPQCAGKDCGDNGCGGTCGACAEGMACLAGNCAVLADDCGGITWEGCCAGSTLKYCDAGQLVTADCEQMPSCGWSSDGNFYDCGTTGAADPAGTFVKNCPACTPKCGGKQCGDDGCGGSCGTCPAGKTCADGQCVAQGSECLGPNEPSAADCGGINDVGCCESDGKLYYCQQGALYCIDCSANPSCGWSAANSWYDCGTGGVADPSGANPMACAGQEGCGGITYEGCCSGTTLKYCDNGQLMTMDCSGEPLCGWNSQGQYYDCSTGGGSDPSGVNPKNCAGCTPSCVGKQCGTDGCGGICGTCSAGKTCQNGICVSNSGGQVGAACTSDAQCLAGDIPLCLLAGDGFPSGYCTSFCDSYGAGACPAGSTCFSFEGQDFALCLDDCSSDLDCRVGYVCDVDWVCFP